MPVEFLQFGGLVAVIVFVALLWFVFVYKARRTGEGDGTPRSKPRTSDSGEERPGGHGGKEPESKE